jgi:hypothetical protein
MAATDWNRRRVLRWIRIILPVAALIPNGGYAWNVPTSTAAAIAHRTYDNNRRQLATFAGGHHWAQFQSRSRPTRSDHRHLNRNQPNVVALTPCHGQRRSNDKDRDTTSDFTTGDNDRDTPWLLTDWASGLFRPLPIAAASLNLAPIFPLALAMLTALVPLGQALCTALLFALLRTIATQLIPFAEFEESDTVDNDDDNEIWNDDAILQLQIDATTFILSFVSAALLFPVGLDLNDASDLSRIGPAIMVLVLLFAVVAVVGWMGVQNVVQQVVTEEQLSDADKQLNTWDRKFRQSRNDQDDNAAS